MYLSNLSVINILYVDLCFLHIKYGEEVIANKEDKMPIYETVTSTQGALTLAMLKEE